MAGTNAPAITHPTADMFRQKKPCQGCPFQRTGGIYHSTAAMTAYASYFLIHPGQTFPCHESVPPDDDRSDFSPWRAGQTLCTGGLIFAEKHRRLNAIMIFGLVQGWLQLQTLQDKEAVVDTLEELLANATDATDGTSCR